MKRLLLVFALLAVTACTGESNLPVPTGKGTIRAINTISASPLVNFRIEERVLGTLSYKGASVGARFDDLEFTFNFDVLFLGDINATRVASQLQKIDANKDYTFVLTGAIDNPTITTWVGDERTWDGSETVFEVRFAHTAVSLGAIDVYFAPTGTAPAIGEQRGTLNFGEILAPIDIAAGNYVYTVTPSGDPATVLFQTLELAYFAQTAFLMPIYDGDETDTGSRVAQIIASTLPAFLLPDAMALPTIRFIQASLDLPNSDVYDDCGRGPSSGEPSPGNPNPAAAARLGRRGRPRHGLDSRGGNLRRRGRRFGEGDAEGRRGPRPCRRGGLRERRRS